mgnify:CR=1 FL=1
MGITSAIVLFLVIWFMVFLMILPLGNVTQGDTGEVEPGTHRSAPMDARLGHKAKWTTLWAFAVWALIAGAILYSGIGVRDIDWFERMPARVSD